MKRSVLFIGIIVFLNPFNIRAQKKLNPNGKYCFVDNSKKKNTQFAESLLIQPDSSFHHHIRTGALTQDIEGKWSISNDTLILVPQRNISSKIEFTHFKWVIRNGKLLSIDSPNHDFYLIRCR